MWINGKAVNNTCSCLFITKNQGLSNGAAGEVNAALTGAVYDTPQELRV